MIKHLNRTEKITLFLLRVSLGWFMFYAGITKVLDPTWSAAGFLNNAETFSVMYQWLATPGILPLVNLLNSWGLTLVGLSLIFGLGVRVAGVAGAVLMVLYYFPSLSFPYPSEHTLIVDDHIIYAIALVALAVLKAGRVWGVAGWLQAQSIVARHSHWLKKID